jgi:hypothetical protein
MVAELTGSGICAASALEPTGDPLAMNWRTSATRVSRHRFDKSLCPFMVVLTDKLSESSRLITPRLILSAQVGSVKNG